MKISGFLSQQIEELQIGKKFRILEYFPLLERRHSFEKTARMLLLNQLNS